MTVLTGGFRGKVWLLFCCIFPQFCNGMWREMWNEMGPNVPTIFMRPKFNKYYAHTVVERRAR
jgi:hypothetical protein